MSISDNNFIYKENSSGYAILNINIERKIKGDYLVCHMVKNPFSKDNNMEILSSNKICIN